MKKAWPLLLIPFLALVWWQKQFIYDQARLLRYHPSQQIVTLADDTTMTSGARRVFYVNHPMIPARSDFSNYCSVGAEQAAVLGCFKAGQRGIYVLDVTNSELAGIEQVTAAHEMLHAEYERLDSGERDHIDQLLQNYFDNQLTDQTTKDTINGYRKTEPDDLVNEMHSILGTQIANLPPELEQYYTRYFTDRAKVVHYYQSYEAAFSDRQAKIKTYDQQLDEQKKTIDSLEVTVDQQNTSLKAQRSQLESLQSSGDYSAYNSGVASFNRAVDNYNANVQRLRSLIDSYNALVQTRNAIAFEEKNLVDDITAPKLQQQ